MVLNFMNFFFDLPLSKKKKKEKKGKDKTNPPPPKKNTNKKDGFFKTLSSIPINVTRNLN